MIPCKCGGKTLVTDSRVRNETVIRRRKCLKCGARWSTEEIEIGNIRKGFKHNGGGEKPADTKVHALVKVLFEEKTRQGVSWEELSKKSGMSIAAMQDWKYRAWPTLWGIDYALTALGIEITCRRRSP
jgi:transcriptional regulator NrdR family protein